MSFFTKSTPPNIFIFTRDLRISDNLALNRAIKESQSLICVFTITAEQTKSNKFKNDRAIQFMCESLIELAKRIELNIIIDDTNYTHIARIVHYHKCKTIYISRDFTPFALAREQKLSKIAQVVSVDNHTLLPIESIARYKIYTPFYNYISKELKKFTLTEPGKCKLIALTADRIDPVSLSQLYTPMNKIVTGGMTGFNEQLAKIRARKGDEAIKKYGEKRDSLALDNNTKFSAYLKFGVVSPRQIYNLFLSNTAIIRELIFREFFYHQQYHFPEILSGKNYKDPEINWTRSTTALQKWIDGVTGVPVVDAAMRQLKLTGYIPNRARMIVASYLAFDLKINWRYGEQHFARQLTDYDPAQNVWNWAWVVGAGNATRPTGQQMNVYIQAKKHDPQAIYIKRWVTELKDKDAAAIHKIRP